MASHKSAIKRIRQNKRRADVNQQNRSKLRTQVKKLQKALGEQGAAAQELLRPTVSVIDKAVQKGVISRNKAARMKSRLTLRLNAASAAA